MKAQIISTTLAAAVVALASGCGSTSASPQPPVYSQYPAGTHPNTYPAGDTRDPNQTARGAVAGAAAGAVIGGIIGNNSNNGNTEKGAAIGAVAGGIAGAAVGRKADQREAGTVYSPASANDTHQVVHTIPPAPVSEPQENPPPQPAQNALWIRGHYVYTGSGYQWQPGRWEVPPGGARSWVQPSWQPAANGGYVYVRGHWQ